MIRRGALGKRAVFRVYWVSGAVGPSGFERQSRCWRTPSRHEKSSVLRRLLETQRVVFPGDVIGYDFGNLLLKKTSRAFMVLAGLYTILPDLLSLNPLDDLLVSGPCFLVGLILMIIVSLRREDAQRGSVEPSASDHSKIHPNARGIPRKNTGFGGVYILSRP